MINTAFNFISLGKWNELRKQYGFDKLFHLALVANVGGKNVIIEKNEVVNVSTSYQTSKDTETLPINLQGKSFTISEMLDTARKTVGDKTFFDYDAFNNNCQFFLRFLLEGQGLYSEDAKTFLFQDLQEVLKGLPAYVPKIAKAITTTGAVVNKLLGKGDDEEEEEVGGKKKPKTPKAPKEPKAPKAPKEPKAPKAPKEPKVKSTLMKWVDALKLYNKGENKWCIPRKGTPEYSHIQKIRRGYTPPTLIIEEIKPEPESEPVIEPIPAGKSFDKDFREYIDEVMKGEGNPFLIDYSASTIITDYIFLYLMNKYKDECGVFVKSPEGNVFATGVDFANPIRAKLYKFQIVKRIEDCVAGGSKIVAIPFGIQDHANMMIYRPSNNTMEHYEPHGDTVHSTASVLKQRNKVVDVFKSWIKDWEIMGYIPEGSRFIPSNEVCPNPRGLQAYESEERRKNPAKYTKGAIGGGFCQMWSLFYLEMCLKYPTESGTELNTKAINELNKMGLNKFIEHIIKYTEALNKAVAKMIDKDVKITSKDLRKDQILREEIRQIFNKMVKEYLIRNKPAKLLSDTTQVARLKEKTLILHKKLQEASATVNSSKGAKKKEAQKESDKIEQQIIMMNRGIDEIEQEQNMTGAGIPEEVGGSRNAGYIAKMIASKQFDISKTKEPMSTNAKTIGRKMQQRKKFYDERRMETERTAKSMLYAVNLYNDKEDYNSLSSSGKKEIRDLVKQFIDIKKSGGVDPNPEREFYIKIYYDMVKDAELTRPFIDKSSKMKGAGIPEEVESVFSKLSKDKATISFYDYVKKHSKDTNVGLYFIQQMYPKWLKSKEAKAIVAEMAIAPTAPTAPTLEISEVAEKKGRKKLTETERLAKKKAYDAKRHAKKLKEQGKPARKKLTEAERKAKRAEYDAKRRVKGGNIPMNGVIYDYENDSDYESSDC
jgi:hypothetical protein